MWGQHMMGGHTAGDGVWWSLTTVFFWIMVVALVTAAIVFLIKQVQLSRVPGEHGEDPAIAILRARFAQGEINSEQFDLMRRTLGERTVQRTEDAK